MHRFHAIRAEQRREGLLVYLWQYIQFRMRFQLTQSRGSRQIVESRMVPAEHAPSGLQGSLQERLGLAIAALDLIKERQIVDARKRTGMLLALAHC